MMIKTVLTVTSPNLGVDDLKLAATLCEEIEAHLAVLIIALAAPPPIGEYAAVVSDVWLQERQTDLAKLREHSDTVSMLLASSPAPTDISSEYQETAWADEAIGRRARYTDLTLVGPDMLSHDSLKEKVIEGALFHSGKPLLLIPDGCAATLKPKRIMVAWDSRIEASRAVAHTVDLLTTAEDVRLVLVDPIEGEDAHGAEPGADIATFLAHHGVKVAVDRLPSQGKSVASVLRQHAADMAAEFLVMGAYGHSRLRQRIFGGVTSSILQEPPPLPILMAR